MREKKREGEGEREKNTMKTVLLILLTFALSGNMPWTEQLVIIALL